MDDYPIGNQMTYVTRNSNGSTLLLLGEGDNTGDGRVTLEDGNSLYNWDYYSGCLDEA